MIAAAERLPSRETVTRGTTLHAKMNPRHFEADQLYHLTTDPAENDNVFDQYPQVAEQLKRELSVALLQFVGRTFGEFTR